MHRARYWAFTDMGEVLQELGGVFDRPDLADHGSAMITKAAELLVAFRRSLQVTRAGLARNKTNLCSFSFVAGGSSCSVADGTQSSALQARENEPWRSYSELVYSGALPEAFTAEYLEFAANHDKSMKGGMLSGTGPSCSGPQLQTFTFHNFGVGL